jgi:hypothetical protein
MKNKLSLFFVLFTVLTSVFAGVVSGIVDEQWYEDEVDIKEMLIYVDGEPVWYGECTGEWTQDPWKCWTEEQYFEPSIERGTTLPVKVVFEAEQDHEEVSVKAWINGYREDIEDETGYFDIFEGKTYTRYLYLDIPEDIDALDQYTLYVEIQNSQAFDGVAEARIDLQVQKGSNVLEIKSVEFYAGHDFCGCYAPQVTFGACGGCSVAFEASSTLYAEVVVKNMGSQTQDDVFVKLSIPSECIERTVYLGDLEGYTQIGKDTEEVTLFIVLPEQPGSYEVEVEAFNDDVSTTVTQELNVAEKAEADVHIIPQVSRNDVGQGESTIYSLYVSNLGSAETFMVSVEGTQGWATVNVDPATFTLDEGESEMVNIHLNVDKDAMAAEHQFTVKVTYGNEVKSYNFSANVTGDSTQADGLELKSLLLIIGIILAVAIIVLLILLIAKNGNKGRIERPEEEYSYY